MTANLERFRKDLDRLAHQGHLLMYAMMRDVHGSDFTKQVYEQLDKQRGEQLLKSLPDFKEGYEAWYSESLALLGQLLPERIDTFKSLYEKPRARKSIEYGNYVIQDYMLDLVRKNGLGETIVDPGAALPKFKQQLAILKAAKTRFDSSLFEIRQLVQADLFDSEIDAARELLKNKFLRAAGAVAGVVLEKHLLQVCGDHAVKVTKRNPTISDLNDLLKANSVIEVPQWRHISMLGDIRNLCDYNKHKEPTTQQVVDLIDGVDKTLKTVA